MANVSVGTTATLIVPSNAKRVSIIVENEGASEVFIGSDSTVTVANGVKLVVDGTLCEDTGGTRVYKGPIYGIVASGTADLRYWERESNI